jgi:uncharacterized NAD(P)/FAD-binding protein YdhS
MLPVEGVTYLNQACFRELLKYFSGVIVASGVHLKGYRIALVGAGPTAIYTLQALLTRAVPPAVITIFERQRRAGQGTPYSANWADPIMLANIASIEIPPLPQRLADWLRSETDERLASLGIARADIDDRAFYPQLALGEYLSAQFLSLVHRARNMGIEIEVRTQTRVTDVRITGERITLTVTDSRNTENHCFFDYVILATGHQWPSDPEVRPGYFTSPWPASALARVYNCAVGIRGSSLSAIDASVALANHHGQFVQTDGNELEYRANPGTEKFAITMCSRKGILPEADFYHPIPYEPLAICTAGAIEELIAQYGPDGLLDAAFELFHQELTQADPHYVHALGLFAQTPEEFCDAYFEKRAQTDAFIWAKHNLDESVTNAGLKFTVKWRYAILRMHEVFGLLAPRLSDLDFIRFSATLKTVFVDNYATVPHESIRRLLALHAARKLFVIKLEEGARVDTWSSGGGAILWDTKSRVHFPAFIEALGQQVSSAKDFPFPSLRRQGVIQDVKTDGQSAAERGIAIDGDFHPISAYEPSQRLFCLSLPFLLGQHPFAQGITSSAEMAEVVADAIAAAESMNSNSTVEMPRHTESTKICTTLVGEDTCATGHAGRQLHQEQGRDTH